MIICIGIYIILLALWLLQKKLPKSIFLVLFLCNTLALGLFVMERISAGEEIKVTRNTYGDGSKQEEYEVVIGDEEESESFELEVSEQEYTGEEIEELFQKVMEELDTVILAENESFNRVETDLNLVTSLGDYPVQIQWELDSYEVMDIAGSIREEHVTESGTLIEIRGTISYLEEKVIYVRHAMVYPVTREGTEKLLYEIELALKEREAGTRKEASFTLPDEVSGVALTWSRKNGSEGYYVLLMGIVLAVFIVYREKEKGKKAAQLRKDDLLRGYPGMISKFTMLLDTGMTVKHAWEKIVQNYEQQKEQMGAQTVYEEMSTTLHEIQGGIPEGEAYERFGKRCEMTIYLKFGAMLSQNLRKGSRGISDILRMEAIQSFENRKSQAKRLGEEAGTKLLMPMMGMLAVVLIMVMVPAFLTMQL
ncbi:MAG: type II secretion system F family protein [Tyzzerella sp.]|nr:type II secretion system F family protein [Tyzzerella sp.]